MGNMSYETFFSTYVLFRNLCIHRVLYSFWTSFKFSISMPAFVSKNRMSWMFSTIMVRNSSDWMYCRISRSYRAHRFPLKRSSRFVGIVCTGTGCQIRFSFHIWSLSGGKKPAKFDSALESVRSIKFSKKFFKNQIDHQMKCKYLQKS